MKAVFIYKISPFIIKKASFTPASGRDIYLGFYIEATKQEILNSSPKRKHFTNISKEELNSLRTLSQDKSIII